MRAIVHLDEVLLRVFVPSEGLLSTISRIMSFGQGCVDKDSDQSLTTIWTPTAETLCFGDIYEQVTNVAPASTAQTYYVHSPERVVAVVTQGEAQLGTLYVHVHHLGSVDALTDASGAVHEHRSYDQPFQGPRRTCYCRH